MNYNLGDKIPLFDGIHFGYEGAFIVKTSKPLNNLQMSNYNLSFTPMHELTPKTVATGIGQKIQSGTKKEEPGKQNPAPTSIARKSGFAMARLVLLAIILSSCSASLNLTQAQREQKKFERFKLRPNELILYSAGTFLSVGLGKHYQLKKD